MILELFALYDAKAAVFAAPFAAVNAGVARRMVHQSLDPETLYARYPDDFQLFLVGTYDDATGAIVGRPPVSICTVVNLLVRSPSPSEELDTQQRQ